jgi:hypothetical protein
MVRNRTKQTAQSQDAGSTIEIPEDEQLRLIKESGIMETVTGIPKPDTYDKDEEITPFAEELFGAIVLIVPFCFLLLLMEMCGSVYNYGNWSSINQHTPDRAV